MKRTATLLTALMVMIAFAPAAVQSADELEQRASWSMPEPGQWKSQVWQWMDEQQAAEINRLKVEALWPEDQPPMAPGDLLLRIAETAAVFDDLAAQVLQRCSAAPANLVLQPIKIADHSSLPPVFANNLRLLYGRWVAQHRFYDEALEQLEGLEPEQVADPAALLFYQSACYHRMMDKENCLTRVARLMENEEQLPDRFAKVARLMEMDLKPLKTDSLDEVARLMDEVQRRLDLYQAGQRVRKQEDDVVAKLDKIIEELEKQSGSGSGGGNLTPSNPAQDSGIMGGTGPGNVDPKNIGSKSGWGNLPAKERQEVLQQISKDLPAHYREVIEEYFRKLAQSGGN